MPAKVYTDKDADLAHLNGKMCAVIGFGSQGHAHALNLKDSGVQVVVGLYKGSKSVPVAEEHGFQVLEVSEAAKKADIIFFATPDLKSASSFREDHFLTFHNCRRLSPLSCESRRYSTSGPISIATVG